MSSRVGIQQFVSATEPVGTQVGDEWFNSATNLLYKRTMVGGTLGWAVLGTSNTTGTAGQVLGLTSAGNPGYITVSVPGNATPACAGIVYACTPTAALNNLSIGYCTNAVMTCGCQSLAVGYGALKRNLSGCANIALGFNTLQNSCYSTANVAIGSCAMYATCAGSYNVAIGCGALQSGYQANYNVAVGTGALQNNCAGGCNVAIGMCANGSACCANFNVAIGWNANGLSQCGNCNISIGYGAHYSSTGACDSIAIGTMALRNSTTSWNIGIGCCAGCAIISGCGNVIIGSYAGASALSNTFVVQAGATERIKVDGTGLYINGAAFTGGGGAASGGSGLFNTSISNQIGYSVTDKLFDLTGSAGTYTNLTTIVVGSTATNGVAAVMPSTTGTRYLIHSIHITNTAASDAEVTGRFDHTQGFGGTATIQGSLIDHTSLFASRLPVPTGSAVELMKKPQVLNPNDWIRLQSTTAAGGSGINGALTAFIVYEASTDWNYTGVGINLASSSPTNVYTSALNTTTNTVTATNYPSVIESVRVTNYSNAADYRVTVSWTNSVGTVQSYLAYNMLIPAFATVELLEKPKRITSGDIIKATPEAPNVLSIQVSGKLITTTFV
jgi:hypothetical protein